MMNDLGTWVNNAWDGIADQVGLIKESAKMITVSWITAGGGCYVLILRKINSFAFREFNSFWYVVKWNTICFALRAIRLWHESYHHRAPGDRGSPVTLGGPMHSLFM